MEQDVNLITDLLSDEWLDIVNEDKKRIAILLEENHQLKNKVEELEDQNESLKNNKETKGAK